MIISSVIGRLAAVAKPPLVAVEGAEELEAIARGTAPAHATAFVVPFREAGSPNLHAANAWRQQIDTSFLVAIVIRQHGDAKGARRVSAIDTLRGAVEAALAGWVHAAECLPIELAAANARTADNGVTWFVQTWRTNRWIEGTTT